MNLKLMVLVRIKVRDWKSMTLQQRLQFLYFEAQKNR